MDAYSKMREKRSRRPVRISHSLLKCQAGKVNTRHVTKLLKYCVQYRFSDRSSKAPKLTFLPFLSTLSFPYYHLSFISVARLTLFFRLYMNSIPCTRFQMHLDKSIPLVVDICHATSSARLQGLFYYWLGCSLIQQIKCALFDCRCGETAS